MPETFYKPFDFRSEDLSNTPIRNSCVPGKIAEYIEKVSKDIYVSDWTIRDFRKEYEEIDWDWRKVPKQTPEDHMLDYASAFHTELMKHLNKQSYMKHIHDLSDDLKEYSSIIGNWILNNHLMMFGRLTSVVTSPVVLECYDLKVVDLIVRKTYSILRTGGCNVDITVKGDPFIRYPYPMVNEHPVRYSLPKDITYGLKRKFAFIVVSPMIRGTDRRDIYNALGSLGPTYFQDKFPAIIISTPWADASKTEVIRYVIDANL